MGEPLRSVPPRFSPAAVEVRDTRARRDALVAFIRFIVLNPGTLPAAQVEALQGVGYSGEQVAHIALAISVITFTNVFNRINDTVLDFPKPQ